MIKGAFVACVMAGAEFYEFLLSIHGDDLTERLQRYKKIITEGSLQFGFVCINKLQAKVSNQGCQL